MFEFFWILDNTIAEGIMWFRNRHQYLAPDLRSDGSNFGSEIISWLRNHHQ